MHASAERPKYFIEHLPRESGSRHDQRLAGHLFKTDFTAAGQRIFYADHQAQAVAINMMNLQVGRFQRKTDDDDIHGAVFHALHYLMAEIAVDADMHLGKFLLKL